MNRLTNTFYSLKYRRRLNNWIKLNRMFNSIIKLINTRTNNICRIRLRMGLINWYYTKRWVVIRIQWEVRSI